VAQGLRLYREPRLVRGRREAKTEGTSLASASEVGLSPLSRPRRTRIGFVDGLLPGPVEHLVAKSLRFVIIYQL